MLHEIEDLYAYDRWANHRTLDAAARLSPEAIARDLGSSFPSVRDTLVHILAAEWVWLSRWRGHSPTGMPDSWDVSTLNALRKTWADVERDQQAFLAGLTDEALQRVVAYRDIKGVPYESPLWQMMRHVVNHSSYHRGQVVTMLRQLGAEPAATDLTDHDRDGAMTRTETRRIQAQLRNAIEGGAWHGPALQEILEDLGASAAAARPVSAGHSPWEIVLHVISWIEVVDRRSRGLAAGPRPDRTGLVGTARPARRSARAAPAHT